MESDRIRMKTLLVATAAIVLLESVSSSAVSADLASAMVATGLTRCVGIGILLMITFKMQGRLDAIGLRPSAIGSGILRGIVWSMGFGAVVVVGLAVGRLSGIIPVGLFQSRMPQQPIDIFSYFLVGAGVAPIAEEIYFRGLVFGYLRRWGPIAAILGSTLLFVVVHPDLQNIPIPQIVGGLLFALSYEVEKNLMVPIIIHMSGNLAIFSLPYLY
ncbi:MAG: CPBP family intramembrane glutamic endopeptidase [Desulfobacterales bacterium]